MCIVLMAILMWFSELVFQTFIMLRETSIYAFHPLPFLPARSLLLSSLCRKRIESSLSNYIHCFNLCSPFEYFWSILIWRFGNILIFLISPLIVIMAFLRNTQLAILSYFSLTFGCFQCLYWFVRRNFPFNYITTSSVKTRKTTVCP